MSVEVTIENCRMLLACPTKPDRLPHPTAPPPASAGTHWPAPACIGAIDEQVWQLMSEDNRRALERRYCRDAGFRKADVEDGRFRLRWIKLMDPKGKMQILADPVEVEMP